MSRLVGQLHDGCDVILLGYDDYGAQILDARVSHLVRSILKVLVVSVLLLVGKSWVAFDSNYVKSDISEPSPFGLFYFFTLKNSVKHLLRSLCLSGQPCLPESLC